jgi:hypothetical protein
LVQIYFKRFGKGQVEDEKIEEIKRNIKEEKSPTFQKMRKVCCGIKEGFVWLTSRNWRIRYFVKRMSLLIPFIPGELGVPW